VAWHRVSTSKHPASLPPAAVASPAADRAEPGREPVGAGLCLCWVRSRPGGRKVGSHETATGGSYLAPTGSTSVVYHPITARSAVLKAR
jgi:hypothetical protein